MRKKPCGCWRRGQKTRKMRKQPCGLLMMRAKNKKNEKKALRSVEDEGENQEK